MTQNKNFLELFLQPLTPLVFGKMRTLETSGITYSYYPLPLPSTVAGMIRSIILEHLCANNSNLERCFNEHRHILGDYGKYTGMNWMLIGPYLARRIENEAKVYYPQPIDTAIIREEKNNESRTEVLKFSIIREDYDSDLLRNMMSHFMDTHKYLYKDNLIPIPINKEKKLKQVREYVISAGLMEKYLGAKYKDGTIQDITLDPTDAIAVSDIVKKKEEIGVALDEQKQVAMGETPSGMLYRVERLYYRVDTGWGIYIALYSEDNSVIEELKNIFIEKEIIAKIGGEGGLVKISVIDNSDLLEKDTRYTETNKQARLILTSPAILKDQYVVLSSLSQELYGLFSQEIITGWSLAKESPRKTLIGVKSGSIFIIKPNEKISVFSRPYVFDEYRNFFGSALIGDY